MSYLTVDPGFLVGELPHSCGGHNVIHTGANVPSDIFSIFLHVDRKVIQRGCSFKQGKAVLQDALRLWGPEFDLFGDRICLF